jgi:hypothetical protein
MRLSTVTAFLSSAVLGIVLGSASACADASSSGINPQDGILTPASGPAPRINGPNIFGARPSSPFLYTIPATGDRPMSFSVDGLPAGLTLDAATGQITGTVKAAATYPVTLHASNAAGTAQKAFRIVIGDKIALTPPMGWNSWNCWGDSVSQDKVLRSAKALVDKGLNQHGWSYINIDDGWQGPRGGQFNALQPNPKFPDIKELSGDIHGMGLKFGVYSTPWALSYAGYPGSACNNADGTYDWIVNGDHNKNFKIAHNNYKKALNGKEIQPSTPVSFASQDAQQWAAWGVDYLKYDWYPNDVASTETMSKALHDSGRDIVLSMSNSAPFEHAADWARLANSWRTTGDISDSWSSVSGALRSLKRVQRGTGLSVGLPGGAIIVPRVAFRLPIEDTEAVMVRHVLAALDDFDQELSRDVRLGVIETDFTNHYRLSISRGQIFHVRDATVRGALPVVALGIKGHADHVEFDALLDRRVKPPAKHVVVRSVVEMDDDEAAGVDGLNRSVALVDQRHEFGHVFRSAVGPEHAVGNFVPDLHPFRHHAGVFQGGEHV